MNGWKLSFSRKFSIWFDIYLAEQVQSLNILWGLKFGFWWKILCLKEYNLPILRQTSKHQKMTDPQTRFF